MIYTDGIHLVADSLDELHAFAEACGIKRAWFEGMRKGHPHYDIPKKFLDKIISFGVKRVSPKEIVKKAHQMHPAQNSWVEMRYVPTSILFTQNEEACQISY